MNDVVEQLTTPNQDAATEPNPGDNQTTQTTETAVDNQTTETQTAQQGFDLNTLSAHYAEHGSLTDEHYSTLEANGIPRSVVDDYIETQKKLAELTTQMEGQKAEQAVLDVLKAADVTLEAFDQMVQWANLNLTDQQKARYEKLVGSDDPDFKATGVSMLKDLFLKSNGQPAATTIESKPDNTTGSGYATRNAALADISKPEYESDPDFRAQVDRKLQMSTFNF